MMRQDDGQADDPANDNGEGASASPDRRILRIAQAIGRHIAREQRDLPAAANDDDPIDRS